MEPRPGEERIPTAWWTIILLAAIAAFLFATTAFFAGTFRSYVPVTLTSDRSGLILETNAKVKLRGVQVGRVS
ncbi:MAG: phospholipid/cholesterol/gamma-HCH transport system substrate-binding protein, partial [Mycobacterium sp.]|nr:phospholipid/cholesterol/gamma-HCH transport system substrate-binding protein [Mycobacterium sp.]